MSESPSTYWPDTIKVQWDVKLVQQHGTDIVTSFSGREQRRAKFPSGAYKGGYRTLSASSDVLNAADRDTVIQFLNNRRGAFEPFWIFLPMQANYTLYPAGTVSGSSTFLLPFKASTVSLVTVGGVSKAFTVQAAIGAGGEDQITFSAGAQTGAVAVTLVGRERLVVRAQDSIGQAFSIDGAGHRTMFDLMFKEVA